MKHQTLYAVVNASWLEYTGIHAAFRTKKQAKRWAFWTGHLYTCQFIKIKANFKKPKRVKI